MIDPAIEWIHQAIQQTSGEQILCADENHLGSASLSNRCTLQLFTNRYDIANQPLPNNVSVTLNDFDFSSIKNSSIDHFFYRISKEKAVTHHVINEAARCLKHGGTLWLAGGKNEGIKTYIEKTSALFGETAAKKKNGNFYFSHIKKSDAQEIDSLDDSNYPILREISLPNLSFMSKPGIFGWNKIDRGSELLAEAVRNYELDHQINHIIDLGCGYGYLTLATLDVFNTFTNVEWTLTDNNEAALRAARQNVHQRKINANVIASDAGNTVTTQADIILCNPPFHQGFFIDGDLTTKFLKNTKRLLKKEGLAFFVVNQFIPLEKKAAEFSLNSIQLSIQEGFKLIVLSN